MARRQHSVRWLQPALSMLHPKSSRTWLLFVCLVQISWMLTVARIYGGRLSSIQQEGTAATEAPVKIVYPDANRTAPANHKPYFIIHIGPPKTATTTLQYELTTKSKELQLDNYVYLGQLLEHPDNMWEQNHGRLLPALLDTECQHLVNDSRMYGTEQPWCWRKFVDELARERAKHRNVILSEEFLTVQYGELHGKLSRTSVDWPTLRDVLEEQGWHPIVLIGYRRLYDIMPSAKQQWDRWSRGIPRLNEWPPEGDHLQPLFPNVLENPRLYDNYVPTYDTGHVEWSYTDHCIKMVEPYFEYRLMNLHDDLSLRSTLMCRVLPYAPKACYMSQLDERYKVKELHQNSEESLFYDALTTAAADRGWFDPSLYRRRDVAVEVRTFYEKWGEVTDFPLVCPNESDLSILLERSLVKEQQILGHKAAESLRNEHIAGFQRSIDKNKFCWIDIEETFRDPLWKKFFKSLVPEED